MIPFGTKLKIMRAILNISQVELARKAGLQQYDISFLETGKVSPNDQIVSAFNAALGIRLDSPEVDAAFRVLAGINQPELPLAMEEARMTAPPAR